MDLYPLLIVNSSFLDELKTTILFCSFSIFLANQIHSPALTLIGIHTPRNRIAILICGPCFYEDSRSTVDNQSLNHLEGITLAKFGIAMK